MTTTTTTTTATAKSREGWHTVYGVDMHTDARGYIDRVVWTCCGDRRPGHIYRVSKHGCWIRDDSCTIAAYRAALARGTVAYM